eukprot:scaffold1051_cov119-Cylindrotheca_fusiformis.AAC.19
MQYIKFCVNSRSCDPFPRHTRSGLASLTPELTHTAIIDESSMKLRQSLADVKPSFDSRHKKYSNKTIGVSINNSQ